MDANLKKRLIAFYKFQIEMIDARISSFLDTWEKEPQKEPLTVREFHDLIGIRPIVLHQLSDIKSLK